MKNDIRLDVKQLLEDINLYRIPVNPKEVCKKLQIVYDERPYVGFEGILLVEGGTQTIGVSTKIESEERKSFTCAHELGHYHYDIKGDELTIKCTRDDVGYGKQKINEMEMRANQFGSELLMPTDFILEDIKNVSPSFDVIKSLAKKYKTSLQVAANKFVSLTHHTCWIVVAKDGKLQRFTKADHNEFLIDLSRSFRPQKRSNTNQWLKVTADNWLYPSYRTRNKFLHYTFMAQNSYGENMFLLWDQGDTLLNEETDEDQDIF